MKLERVEISTYLVKLDQRLAAIETSIIAISLITGAALNFLLVFGRFVLNLSLSSFEEISIYSIIWMTFVGTVLADRNNNHISIDILQQALNKKWRLRIESIIQLVLAILAFSLTFYSFKETIFSFAIGETAVSTLETPIWLVMIIMPISFFLVGIRNLVLFLRPKKYDF